MPPARRASSSLFPAPRSAALAAWLASALFAPDEGDEVNVALSRWGATATASSIYGHGYEADRALDGRVGGENDKWNSAADAAPHWLIVDLGAPRTIHRIVVRHEGVRGEGARYNTSDFQLQRGDSPAGPWTDLVAPVAGSTANVTESVFAPVQTRHLRLLVTTGEQGGRNEYARIFEIEAYAARSALSSPLVAFDWADPPLYRRRGEQTEQLAVVEYVAAGILSTDTGTVIPVARLALDGRPAAWRPSRGGDYDFEFWVPLRPEEPVAAELRLDDVAVARHSFAAPAAAYFAGDGAIGIVSSSHQDTAWMDTPDFCRRFRIEQNILPALEMMAKDPDYCFAMECTLHLMEFLAAHPERRDEIARLTREGRLEWGATYNQPYESWLSGEELVRQTYYGRRWIRKNLPGCDARVAFNPDVPARAWQMQQILARAGVPYLFLSRYHEGLYRWKSPDGSSVLAYSPGHYGNHLGLLNGDPAACVDAIQRKLEEQGTYYRERRIPPAYCLINSMDFSRPVDFRPLIQAWNASGEEAGEDADLLGPPMLRYSSLAAFFAAVDRPAARIDTRQGERPDVWLYIHGPTHHWTSSLRREAARLLPAAETFTTMAGLLAGSLADYPAAALDEAWMAELYPDHGIGGKNGHLTDLVFHRKVELARDTGRALLDAALGTIAGRVRVSPAKGLPVVVFNTLSWARTAPVEIDLPAALAGPVRVVDAAGREIPAQRTSHGLPAEIDVAAAAMGATATASSSFGPAYAAAKAIDGKWAERDADKWCSAAGAGPHWLAVGLGQPRTIHRVVIRHEGVLGAFGAEAKYNTAAYRIQGADAAEGPWIDLVPPIAGSTASLTAHSFAPRTVRFLRLYITAGTAAGNDGQARIYELHAFAPAERRTSRLVFVAADVPATGYATYYVSAAGGPGGGDPPPIPAAPPADFVVENAFYRLALAPGGVRGLFDKEQGRELLDPGAFLGGEVFTMLSVAPENRGLGTDAGEFGSVPMPVRDESFDRVADHAPGWTLREDGPVRTVYELAQPLGGATVRQRVVVWNTMKRIDCEVDLAEFDGTLWREFRMALPLAMDEPAIAYEVPMGVVQIGQDEVPGTGGHAYGRLTYSDRCADIRPREVQNFVDASDGKGGLTMSSDVAVFDWRDPTGRSLDRPVLQPVLLASRRSCHGEGNWYPQAGDHSYRFAITTHAGGWRQGWRPGIAANHPLVAIVGGGGGPAASLPESFSFLAVSAPNLVVSTIKKSEDDDAVVLRSYDIEGRDSRPQLRWFLPLAAAELTNLIEEEGTPLAVSGRELTLEVGHHAIATVRVRASR
ncbi:MAG: discoidin domain-containing protein [Planctomycetota bacterium]